MCAAFLKPLGTASAEITVGLSLAILFTHVVAVVMFTIFNYYGNPLDLVLKVMLSRSQSTNGK